MPIGMKDVSGLRLPLRIHLDLNTSVGRYMKDLMAE